MKSKKLIIAISIIVVLILLVVLFPYFFPKKYAVLTYHDFTTKTPENNMQKNIDEFKKEMKYLKKHNYKTLTLKDVECYMNKKCDLPRKSVLITFDDGWKNEYELALPILKEYDFNAVIFYLGEKIDKSDPNFISQDELEIIKDFDEGVRKYFDKADIIKGYLEVTNRKGIIEEFPITTISIGVVEVDEGRFSNPLEIGEAAAGVKHLAKTIAGSTYVIDRRKKEG